MNEKLHDRPRRLETPPIGERAVVLKVTAYWLKPEGFLPEETAVFVGEPKNPKSDWPIRPRASWPPVSPWGAEWGG